MESEMNEDESNQDFEDNEPSSSSKTPVLAPAVSTTTNVNDDLSWETEILDSDEEDDVLEAFGSTVSMEDTAKRPAKVPKVIQDWRELGAKHHRQVARRRRLQLYHSNNNSNKMPEAAAAAGCHDDDDEPEEEEAKRPLPRSVQLLFKASEARAVQKERRQHSDSNRNRNDKNTDKNYHGYREGEPERSRRRGSDPYA